MLLSTFILSTLASAVAAQLSESNLKTYVGTLPLSANFNPIKESYWTGLPHHRRTPFAVSPDGKSAYLAYLDASQTGVHVQQVDPSTFAAVGTAVTVAGGKEAGGLVAHNDGFALLTNEAMPSGTSNAPPASTPVPVLYRYTSGKQTFKTWLGGPDNVGGMGALASPDMNGDLAYSETAKMYGAYFVVTAYSGDAQGHFGDAIQYVSDAGKLTQIQGASSSWGCSHNTGIAFEAADSVPFASLCSEDQGAIWLNTGGTGMSKAGVKVSNENVQNGAGNEAMGGMSGSYSGLARFIGSDSYIFTWVSRGAKDLTTNEWMGNGYTNSVNRTVNRNVAIATFSDKKTIVGEQATSTLGPDGDKQVNWITQGSADCQNAHVAAFDKSSAIVTWEEIAEPTCEFIAMGCKGAFTGSYFQLVKDGKKVGTPVKKTDVYVAGDMVTMSDGRVCWPYVDMAWKLDAPVRNAASVKAISFACMSNGANSDATGTPIVIDSSAAAAPTPAPVDSALPSFAIVSSGATIDPVSTPAAAITPIPTPATPVAPSSVASPIETPSPEEGDDEDLPCDDSEDDSEVPAVSATPSPQVPSNGQATPSSPASPIATPSPEETGDDEDLPCDDEAGDAESDDTDTPLGASKPFPSATATPPYPYPSGFPTGSGSRSPPTAALPTGTGRPGSGHGRPTYGRPGFNWGRPRPSGWGSWPKPTGGFGPRPGAGFGPEKYDFGLVKGQEAKSTPCTFETRVRPSATPKA
ncbi:hypothetical protein BKA63DRAFT_402059 [Paraphoma chrysanthemicola]|nr:hypothetical protein BKA63DRAFT_402059 [Paraphoma chrysanthemicola]